MYLMLIKILYTKVKLMYIFKLICMYIDIYEYELCILPASCHLFLNLKNILKYYILLFKHFHVRKVKAKSKRCLVSCKL